MYETAIWTGAAFAYLLAEVDTVGEVQRLLSSGVGPSSPFRETLALKRKSEEVRSGSTEWKPIFLPLAL